MGTRYTLEQLKKSKLWRMIPEDWRGDLYAVQECLMFYMGIECEVEDENTIIIYE